MVATIAMALLVATSQLTVSIERRFRLHMRIANCVWRLSEKILPQLMKKRLREMNCTPKVGYQSNLWGVFHDEA
jgi:hypothetical protein